MAFLAWLPSPRNMNCMFPHGLIALFFLSPSNTSWSGSSSVAQQKRIQLVSMKMRVLSLASFSALLWLWCRPAAAAPIRPLAWEPPLCPGCSPKKQKKKGIFHVYPFTLKDTREAPFMLSHNNQGLDQNIQLGKESIHISEKNKSSYLTFLVCEMGSTCLLGFLSPMWQAEHRGGKQASL